MFRSVVEFDGKRAADLDVVDGAVALAAFVVHPEEAVVTGSPFIELEIAVTRLSAVDGVAKRMDPDTPPRREPLAVLHAAIGGRVASLSTTHQLPIMIDC